MHTKLTHQFILSRRGLFTLGALTCLMIALLGPRPAHASDPRPPWPIADPARGRLRAQPLSPAPGLQRTSDLCLPPRADAAHSIASSLSRGRRARTASAGTTGRARRTPHAARDTQLPGAPRAALRPIPAPEYYDRTRRPGQARPGAVLARAHAGRRVLCARRLCRPLRGALPHPPACPAAAAGSRCRSHAGGVGGLRAASRGEPLTPAVAGAH